VRWLLAVGLVAGCTAFGEPEGAPPPDPSPAEDASVEASPAAVSDAGADAQSSSKRCSDVLGALYCEDFANRNGVDDVLQAFHGGTKQPGGSASWTMVDGSLGDASRALQTSIDSTAGSDSQLGFPFDSTPPKRLRLFVRLRIDEVSIVDVFGIGFTRPSELIEFVYVTLVDGQLRLGEYDSGGNPLAGGGLPVVTGRFYDVELSVELGSSAASLSVDGSAIASMGLTRVVPSDGMTGFRLQYGLFSLVQPRSVARVSYDDVELRDD
jgi:hypothetical protein